MKHVDFLLGNTSSGIIEAASFNKYVINVGDRQKGRLASDNVIQTAPNFKEIIQKITLIKNKIYNGINLYEKEKPSKLIIDTLKKDLLI